MGRTIDLDNKPSGGAIEIHNEAANDALESKTNAECFSTQSLFKNSLGGCEVLSQVSGEQLLFRRNEISDIHNTNETTESQKCQTLTLDSMESGA